MAEFETTSSDANDFSLGDDYDDIFFRDDFDISVEDDYDVHKELIQYIDKKMSVCTINTATIENARRFIFAEDLVSYIALEFHGLIYNTRLDKGSDFFFNPFSGTIREAAHIIRRQINSTNSPSFEIIRDLSKSHKLCYEIFIDAVLSHFSQEGLKAGLFFYICVYVSELAAKCYRSDFEEVFDFAVYAILDAFCMFKGKRYEWIDFAKAVTHKSDQENMMEIFGINLEKLRVVGKSDKNEIIHNLLKHPINKNTYNNQENELEECEAGLEQLSLVDKYDKYEVIGNIEFPINEIVEKLAKSVESHVKNCNLSFCSESCCISLIDKVHDGECKKMPCQTESKIFEDILQEVMSVVNFEASLFSAIYAWPENQLNFDSQDDNHPINIKDKVKSSACSSIKNIQARDSHCMFKELVPRDCIEKKIEDLVNAFITSNSVVVEQEKVGYTNTCDTLQHVDVKFPNDDTTKVFELERNQFTLKRSADNKIKSTTAEFAVNFVQPDIGKKSSEEDSILDYNTTQEEEHNFIEKEAKTLKEAVVVSSSELEKDENEETEEDFSSTLEYENLNFRNIELKELDTVHHSLICENSSKNSYYELEENFKQLECRSIEDFNCHFDDKTALPVDTEDKQIVDFFAVYKSEGEVSDENLKILKGDTILFAEDLVRYVMKEFYSISYSESKFDGIHGLLCNAFSETVKETLHFFHEKSETLNRIIFDIIANIKDDKTDCYRKYVAMVLSHYAEDGLNSDAFLYFCLHFSELAAKLFTLHHTEILEFAICSILDAFCLLKDDWCEFKVATENVLEIFKTKTDYLCTGCKIHSYVGNFEKECVKAILDTLKTFLHEKIEEMFTNNYICKEKINDVLSTKTVENSDIGVNNSQSYETKAIDDKN